MKRAKRAWIISLSILLAAAIIAGGYYWYAKSHTQANLRQAIFLTTGQVYFGYAKNIDGRIIKVKNVYYIKTQDLLQQNSDTSGEKKKISLVKLGNELHGPTDEIFINRDQVLFIENMRSDSKISQAIEKNTQLEN